MSGANVYHFGFKDNQIQALELQFPRVNFKAWKQESLSGCLLIVHKQASSSFIKSADALENSDHGYPSPVLLYEENDDEQDGYEWEYFDGTFSLDNTARFELIVDLPEIVHLEQAVTSMGIGDQIRLATIEPSRFDVATLSQEFPVFTDVLTDQSLDHLGNLLYERFGDQLANEPFWSPAEAVAQHAQEWLVLEHVTSHSSYLDSLSSFVNSLFDAFIKNDLTPVNSSTRGSNTDADLDSVPKIRLPDDQRKLAKGISFSRLGSLIVTVRHEDDQLTIKRDSVNSKRAFQVSMIINGVIEKTFHSDKKGVLRIPRSELAKFLERDVKLVFHVLLVESD